MLLRGWLLQYFEHFDGVQKTNLSCPRCTKPQMTMHFTTYSCDIKTFSPLPRLQKCVLRWFIPFEFDSFKNPTTPTVSCADLIALLSPLTHSEVSLVAHVIKQNWSASCCRCRSCRYTVTWLPLCLGSLLSLGVALVAGTRRGNSSMVLLQSWNIKTTLKHWFHVQPLGAWVFLWGNSCCATCCVWHDMVRLSVLLLSSNTSTGIITGEAPS